MTRQGPWSFVFFLADLYVGSTPHPVTVANEGRRPPTKNIIILVVTGILRWGVDSIQDRFPNSRGSRSLTKVQDSLWSCFFFWSWCNQKIPVFLCFVLQRSDLDGRNDFGSGRGVVACGLCVSVFCELCKPFSIMQRSGNTVVLRCKFHSCNQCDTRFLALRVYSVYPGFLVVPRILLRATNPYLGGTTFHLSSFVQNRFKLIEATSN